MRRIDDRGDTFKYVNFYVTIAYKNIYVSLWGVLGYLHTAALSLIASPVNP